MKGVSLESFDVVGVGVRTKSSDEMNPSKAKVSPLWGKFFLDVLPKVSEGAGVYGVYTNYESDHTGLFDLVACSDGLSLDKLSDGVSLKIKSGKYLVFSAKGELPKATINLWVAIWHYFSASNCVHERAYTTDFEYYKDDFEIEISISIK